MTDHLTPWHWLAQHGGQSRTVTAVTYPDAKREAARVFGCSYDAVEVRAFYEGERAEKGRAA